jgi:hypothetical protein
VLVAAVLAVTEILVQHGPMAAVAEAAVHGNREFFQRQNSVVVVRQLPLLLVLAVLAVLDGLAPQGRVPEVILAEHHGSERLISLAEDWECAKQPLVVGAEATHLD